jgi:hypothetical protein
MASWADHLINFGLDLSAALAAAWVFLKYYPRISDYWAHRSTASVRKKTARLEALLAKYESDFSDSRRCHIYGSITPWFFDGVGRNTRYKRCLCLYGRM